MADATFTEAEAIELCKPVIAAAIAKREIELASALNSALELAGEDSQRLRIAVEMVARTLVADSLVTHAEAGDGA